MIILSLIILMVMGGGIVHSQSDGKEPKDFIPIFSWQGKKEMSNEFLRVKEQLGSGFEGMPSFWPRNFAIRENVLYASDYWNHCIQIFAINSDNSLSLKFIFGKKGEGLGEFNLASKLAISENHLYVVDEGNHHLQVLEINPDGRLTPKFIFGKKGEGLGDFFSGPDDLIIKGNLLYVAETGIGHIQILGINSDGSLSPKFIFNKKGESLGKFNPSKLLIKDNYLYVADHHNHLIHCLEINSDGSLSSKFISGKIGRWGKGLGEFSSGPDSFIIKGSYLYVTDAGNHHIQTFKVNLDGSLTPKFIFGKKGEGLGEFNLASKLAMKENHLYVVDAGNHHLQVLEINSDGSLTPQFIYGQKGEGLGDFFMPNDVVINGDYLYVSDAGNNRIQALEIKH